MIIGITGNIACGKSTIVNYLMSKNYFVLDSDLIVKKFWEDLEFIEKVEKILNIELVNISNYKKIVANIIFNDENKRKMLNDFIHPLVRREIVSKLKERNDDLKFIDVPLLFESHFDELCDIIILVTASKEIQIARLIKRSGINEDEALSIINKQIPDTLQENFSDYVIDNSYSIESLYAKIDDILKKLEEKKWHY